MLFPQKSQYAVRAIFELAKRADTGPIKIADVSKAQVIPIRFLEIILNQLRQGGFVQSIRGKEGGYYLTRPANKLSVGEIIRFMQGNLNPVDCVSGKERCPLIGGCAFEPLWNRVEGAISSVLDSTTFKNLIDAEKKRRETHTVSYDI